MGIWPPPITGNEAFDEWMNIFYRRVASKANAMEKDGGNLAIGSDADGDMYYRASSVLARLAKGAADLKLFMNAAGTLPEWAAGMKYITFTRDLAAAAGDVAITGAGFKPSGAIVIGGIGSGTVNSVGVQASGGYGCLHSRADQALAAHMNVSASLIRAETAAGSAFQTAYFSAWGADGGTLTWAKTGSPTGTATYYAFLFR